MKTRKITMLLLTPPAITGEHQFQIEARLSNVQALVAITNIIGLE